MQINSLRGSTPSLLFIFASFDVFFDVSFYFINTMYLYPILFSHLFIVYHLIDVL